MSTVFRTMLIGQFRDPHTLFWTIVTPFVLLLGLGFWFDKPGYAERLLAGVLAVNVLFGPGMVTPFQVMTLRNRGVFKLLRTASLPTSAFITASAGARTALSLVVCACLTAAGLPRLRRQAHASRPCADAGRGPDRLALLHRRRLHLGQPGPERERHQHDLEPDLHADAVRQRGFLFPGTCSPVGPNRKPSPSVLPLRQRVVRRGARRLAGFHLDFPGGAGRVHAALPVHGGRHIPVG